MVLVLPDLQFLRDRLNEVVLCKQRQGYDTAGSLTQLKKLPESRFQAPRTLADPDRDGKLRKAYDGQQPIPGGVRGSSVAVCI